MNKEVEKEADPNLYFGEGSFLLPNGDSYVGNYCAHRFGLTWREGHGTYFTKDGQSYEGEWRDDKLVNDTPLIIKYPTGDEYHGTLLEEEYSGGGVYMMRNRMDVSCEFFKNKPKGTVVLIDINGRIWEGQAGENRTLLLPENLFFTSISEERGIGKLKVKTKDQKIYDQAGEENRTSNATALSDRELEQTIFAKSKKTAFNIDFAESKWCKRYTRFMTMKKKIAKKIEANETLTEEELKWKIKYDAYKERKAGQEKAKRQKKVSVVNTTLLDTFYSKEFKESCPPVQVMYPTSDWAPDCYFKTENIELEENNDKEEVEQKLDVEKKVEVEQNVEVLKAPKKKK